MKTPDKKFLAFLKKAVESKGFKERDPEGYEKTKAKYDKEKLKHKLL